MSADIAKSAIDLAIVARDAEASVAFYGDFLGLEHVADTTVGSAGVMHRFRVGDSLLKLAREKNVGVIGPVMLQQRRFETANVVNGKRVQEAANPGENRHHLFFDRQGAVLILLQKLS